MADKSPSTTVDAPKNAGGPAPVIVDLGSAKKGQIKQLTKGQGPLTERVLGVISDLRSEGTVSASAQPVIVVVRKKASKKSLLGGLL